jgi:hypothetical protein
MRDFIPTLFPSHEESLDSSTSFIAVRTGRF